jgi:hypothetical protein
MIKDNPMKLVTVLCKPKLHPAQLTLRMRPLYPSAGTPTGRRRRCVPYEEGSPRIEGGSPEWSAIDMTLVIPCAGHYLFVRSLTSKLHANHPSLTTQAHVRFSPFSYTRNCIFAQRLLSCVSCVT